MTLPLFRAVATPIAADRPEPIAPKSSGMWYLSAGRPRRCVIAKLKQWPPATMMSQSFGTAASNSLITGRGRACRGLAYRLGVRVLGGCGDLRGDLVAAPAPTADAPFLEPAHNRLGGRLGVGLDMKVGGSQPLPQPARLCVDPHHLGVGEEIAPLGRVMAEPSPGGNHQIA